MTNYDPSLTVYYQKFSPATESYRALRTNLLFSRKESKDKTQSIVVTSCHSGEGKSVTAANLAYILAQSKHKTLLVDADFRRPHIHEIFGLRNVKGLDGILEGTTTFEKSVWHMDLTELDILTNDSSVEDPTELLSSKKLTGFISDMSHKYDFIIFDTPPVNILTDSILIAPHTNGVLFVSAEGQVTAKDLKTARTWLDRSGAKLIGIVFNKATSSHNQQQYYGYYGKAEDEKNKGIKFKKD